MNDSEPNPLRDQLAALPREIPPARDLWPGIQARVERPWSPAAPPEADKLDPKTLSPTEPIALRSTCSTFRRFRIPLAIAAAITLAATLHWLRPASEPAASWAVASLAGSPQVDRTAIASSARFHVGDWLETDATSRAKVTVGTIGEVSLEPNSRLRLVNASTTDHRLELARGTISALIWAPPRLFFVETPSATAVDLGCAYTLTVDDHGAGVLEVTSGYVALEHGGRESIIPAGLMCRTRPGAGPGTPFAIGAPAEFRQALDRFDTGDATALAQVVTGAGVEDTITLWHLLARASAAQLGPVFDKLASLQPAPAGVTREGILAGDAAMRTRWAADLGLHAYNTKSMK